MSTTSSPITAEILTNATELLKRKRVVTASIAKYQAELVSLEEEIKTAIPPELSAFLDVATAALGTVEISDKSGPAKESKNNTQYTAESLEAALKEAKGRELMIKGPNGLATKKAVLEPIVEANPKRFAFTGTFPTFKVKLLSK